MSGRFRSPVGPTHDPRQPGQDRPGLANSCHNEFLIGRWMKSPMAFCTHDSRAKF